MPNKIIREVVRDENGKAIGFSTRRAKPASQDHRPAQSSGQRHARTADEDEESDEEAEEETSSDEEESAEQKNDSDEESSDEEQVNPAPAHLIRPMVTTRSNQEFQQIRQTQPEPFTGQPASSQPRLFNGVQAPANARSQQNVPPTLPLRRAYAPAPNQATRNNNVGTQSGWSPQPNTNGQQQHPPSINVSLMNQQRQAPLQPQMYASVNPQQHPSQALPPVLNRGHIVNPSPSFHATGTPPHALPTAGTQYPDRASAPPVQSQYARSTAASRPTTTSTYAASRSGATRMQQPPSNQHLPIGGQTFSPRIYSQMSDQVHVERKFGQSDSQSSHAHQTREAAKARRRAEAETQRKQAVARAAAEKKTEAGKQLARQREKDAAEQKKANMQYQILVDKENAQMDREYDKHMAKQGARRPAGTQMSSVQDVFERASKDLGDYFHQRDRTPTQKLGNGKFGAVFSFHSSNHSEPTCVKIFERRRDPDALEFSNLAWAHMLCQALDGQAIVPKPYELRKADLVECPPFFLLHMECIEHTMTLQQALRAPANHPCSLHPSTPASKRIAFLRKLTTALLDLWSTTESGSEIGTWHLDAHTNNIVLRSSPNGPIPVLLDWGRSCLIERRGIELKAVQIAYEGNSWRTRLRYIDQVQAHALSYLQSIIVRVLGHVPSSKEMDEIDPQKLIYNMQEDIDSDLLYGRQEIRPHLGKRFEPVL